MTRDFFFKSLNNIFQNAYDTAGEKNSDYTGDDYDPMYNFRKCNKFGVSTPLGLMVRISDKISRLESLMDGREAKVKDEKLTDTIEDAINYLAFLSIALEEEQRVEEDQSLP